MAEINIYSMARCSSKGCNNKASKSGHNLCYSCRKKEVAKITQASKPKAKITHKKNEINHSGKKGSIWIRHAVVATISFVIYFYFLQARSNWDPEMARWKAVGDAAFILLWTSMIIGPLVNVKSETKILLIWRRQISVWAGLLMALHGYLIWDGWARWTLDGLLGYSELPEVEGIVLMDPGFGLANIMGVVALSMTLILLAISSDWAMNYLGAGSWKRLQNLSHTIWVLVCIHLSYFVFIHYDLSLKSLVFQKQIPEENQFAMLFLILIFIQVSLSMWAFISTVRSKKT